MSEWPSCADVPLRYYSLTHSGPVAPTKLKFKYHLNPEIIVD